MPKRSPAGPLEARVGRRTTAVWTRTLPTRSGGYHDLFATGRYAHVILALAELEKFYTGGKDKERVQAVSRYLSASLFLSRRGVPTILNS
jgi:hypothetical protein